MGRSRVIERDLGWAEIKRRLVKAKGAAVKVGVLESAGKYKPPEGEGEGEPLTIAQIATVHEFGSADGRIPERSFIRTAIDENRADLRETTRKAATAVVDGRMTMRKALGIVGIAARSKIQNRITSGPFVPLAPATIAKRTARLKSGVDVPSEKPLIDTNQMRASIDYEVQLDGVRKRKGTVVAR